jgi:lysozyme
MVEGIDVSDAQGTIDWNLVRQAGIEFAFIKATEGLPGRYHTPQGSFARNWAGSKAAGVRRGAYHYYRPGLDPTEQARHFASIVKSAGLDFADLGPVVDVEEATATLSPDQYGSDLLTFLQICREEFGRKPIVYTSPGPWSGFVSDKTAALIAEAAHLWEAHWGVPAPTGCKGWNAWPGALFWQYAGDLQKSHVAGIGPVVDLDRFRGTTEDLRHYAEATV